MAQNIKITKDKLENLPIVGRLPKNEKEEKYLREIGEYEFYNQEDPGLSHKFPYGATRNKVVFTLFHGGKYHVPRHVADHINSRSTPIWKWRPDGMGSMVKEKVGTKSRFQMRPVYS